MKKILSSIAVILLSAMIKTGAVPAMPGLMKFTQPDGTVIEASLCGDEFFHFYRTPSGDILLLDEADGFLKPASLTPQGTLSIASSTHAAKTGFSEPRMQAALSNHYNLRKAAMQQAGVNRQSRIAPGEIKPTFPLDKDVRGLILLVEYQDVKLLPTSTPEYFDKKINSRNYSGPDSYGSVADYFAEQSQGQFIPSFDIVGPLTLPQNRAYYGTTDKGLINQFHDACKIADTEFDVDFSKYDANGDKFVDFVFVIFAGHGKAQGGPNESVWPAMIDLSTKIYDYFDDMNLGVAACSCELKGGSGEEYDGVGTICHEFSHILGLPDVYDPLYSGGYGMGHFDIMDIGTYNGNQTTPSGYTAMDRYTLGWLNPTVLDGPKANVTLEPFETSNKAYCIVNPDNNNEYYLLENRQLHGWDSALPGHGLVISYIHYDSSLWKRNLANSPGRAGYEHIRLIAADNNWSTSLPGDEEADPFPGSLGKTMFTDDTTPAAKWYSSNKSVGAPITNIREENGIITFDFMMHGSIDTTAEDGSHNVHVADNNIICSEDAEVYTVNGHPTGSKTGLAPGVYIVKQGGNATKVVIR